MPEPHKLVPVDYRTLIKVFERDGFTVSRQKGDHINMTTAGMSRERFFELLELLNRAEQTIQVEMYAFTDDDIAAHRGGDPTVRW